MLIRPGNSEMRILPEVALLWIGVARPEIRRWFWSYVTEASWKERFVPSIVFVLALPVALVPVVAAFIGGGFVALLWSIVTGSLVLNLWFLATVYYVGWRSQARLFSGADDDHSKAVNVIEPKVPGWHELRSHGLAQIIAGIVLLVTVEGILGDTGLLEQPGLSIAIGAAMGGVFQMGLLSHHSRHPVVLILTRSKSEQLKWATEVGTRLWAIRVVCLLEPSGLNADRWLKNLFVFNNLRMDEPQWKASVMRLAQTCPILIVDGREVSEHLLFELSCVLQPATSFKVLLVVSSAGKSPLVRLALERGILVPRCRLNVVNQDTLIPTMALLCRDAGALPKSGTWISPRAIEEIV